jgi:hypothetical protein
MQQSPSLCSSLAFKKWTNDKFLKPLPFYAPKNPKSRDKNSVYGGQHLEQMLHSNQGSQCLPEHWNFYVMHSQWNLLPVDLGSWDWIGMAWCKINSELLVPSGEFFQTHFFLKRTCSYNFHCYISLLWVSLTHSVSFSFLLCSPVFFVSFVISISLCLVCSKCMFRLEETLMTTCYVGLSLP